eukprot:7380365-Prymnesium_polylepis.1
MGAHQSCSEALDSGSLFPPTSRVRRSSLRFSTLSSCMVVSIDVCFSCSTSIRFVRSFISLLRSFSSARISAPPLLLRSVWKNGCSSASATASRSSGLRWRSWRIRSRAAALPTFSRRVFTTRGFVPHSYRMAIASPEAMSSSRVERKRGSPAHSM